MFEVLGRYAALAFLLIFSFFHLPMANSVPSIIGILPARFASTRFPAKALTDIGGKPMIQRTWEQACKAQSLAEIWIATDHPEIERAALSFGAQVVMTSPKHPTGTDRCYQAFTLTKSQAQYLINIQGDEPFIQPEQIDLLAALLVSDNVEIATLIKKIEHYQELESPNTAKVAINEMGKALFFSRHPIPFLRNEPRANWLNHHTYFKHIGMYAYRTDILKKIVSLPQGSLEIAESLEQLRWLEAGFSISTAITPYESLGIDTPSDLDRIKELGLLP